MTKMMNERKKKKKCWSAFFAFFSSSNFQSLCICGAIFQFKCEFFLFVWMKRKKCRVFQQESKRFTWYSSKKLCTNDVRLNHTLNKMAENYFTISWRQAHTTLIPFGWTTTTTRTRETFFSWRWLFLFVYTRVFGSNVYGQQKRTHA